MSYSVFLQVTNHNIKKNTDKQESLRQLNTLDTVKHIQHFIYLPVKINAATHEVSSFRN